MEKVLDSLLGLEMGRVGELLRENSLEGVLAHQHRLLHHFVVLVNKHLGFKAHVLQAATGLPSRGVESLSSCRAVSLGCVVVSKSNNLSNVWLEPRNVSLVVVISRLGVESERLVRPICI